MQAPSPAVAAVFDPVQTATTLEETVERLGTAIRLGLLGPGDRLPPERELADQLGIARSTPRQALTSLPERGPRPPPRRPPTHPPPGGGAGPRPPPGPRGGRGAAGPPGGAPGGGGSPPP